MSEIIAWIVTHWDVLVGILFALLFVASAITGFTKTPDDDAFVRKMIAFLSFLQPKDAVGTVKLPLRSPSEPAVPASSVMVPRPRDGREDEVPPRRL